METSTNFQLVLPLAQQPILFVRAGCSKRVLPKLLPALGWRWCLEAPLSTRLRPACKHYRREFSSACLRDCFAVHLKFFLWSEIVSIVVRV